MGNEYITNKEVLHMIISIGGIAFSIVFAIFSIIVKIAVDKAKLEAMEGDRILDNNINEVKSNYLSRFDDLKKDINEIKLLMEKRFSELEIKILEQKFLNEKKEREK